MTKPKILIVDDELPIRTMLRYALEKADFEVFEAEDAKKAQEAINLKLPGIILLDWMLPNLSGVTFAKSLKQNTVTQDIPIIMITAKADEESIILGLEAADDYMVKPFSPRELIARVRAVLRRGPMTHADGKLHCAGMIIDRDGQRITIDNTPIKLGPLEFRLLCYFVMNKDRVFSRDNLLTHVWGTNSYIDERTVDVHIRRLRKQLTPSGFDRYIQTVHGSGYRFSESHESITV